MRQISVVCFCILSGALLAGCEPNRGVRAGNEDTDTYQPRKAPAATASSDTQQDIRGELTRVDMAGKTIAVRVENGMEQTFKFDDQTMVTGLPAREQKPATAKAGANTNAMRNLIGKEESEVSVQWRDENGSKVASRVDVVEVRTAKSTKGRKR